VRCEVDGGDGRRSHDGIHPSALKVAFGFRGPAW
jgi:hypothetical protein